MVWFFSPRTDNSLLVEDSHRRNSRVCSISIFHLTLEMIIVYYIWARCSIYTRCACCYFPSSYEQSHRMGSQDARLESPWCESLDWARWGWRSRRPPRWQIYHLQSLLPHLGRVVVDTPDPRASSGAPLSRELVAQLVGSYGLLGVYPLQDRILGHVGPRALEPAGQDCPLARVLQVELLLLVMDNCGFAGLEFQRWVWPCGLLGPPVNAPSFRRRFLIVLFLAPWEFDFKSLGFLEGFDCARCPAPRFAALIHVRIFIGLQDLRTRCNRNSRLFVGP